MAPVQHCGTYQGEDLEGPIFPEQTEVGAEGPSKKAEAKQLLLWPPSGCSRPGTRVEGPCLVAACSAHT